ncbi:MAG: apolipoprotein N-acyltransferase [Fibrella sp.]|nr:apolipoprotein N-acyltransferase [Armatimonadota bacterium]
MRLTQVALPVFSAVLLSFCFPFASAWWLSWFALVPLYYVLLRANGNPRSGFVSGFWFGLTLHLVGVFWMNKLGTVPWIGVAVFESGAFAIFGAIAAPLLIRLPSSARPLLFAALWTCLEYARTLGEMAFPWFPIAATQVPVLPMVQIVAVTGQWGLGFALALANGLLGEAVPLWRLKDRKAAEICVAVAISLPVLICLAGIVGEASVASQDTSALSEKRDIQTIAIVQGNVGKVPENAGMDSLNDYRSSSLDTYLQMTRFVSVGALAPRPSPSGGRGEPEGPGVRAPKTGNLSFILWPETVVPGYLLQDPQLQFPVASLAREANTDLLVGTMNSGSKDEKYNSVVHLDPTGNVVRTYAKQRLVPMGEFFLFRDVLGDIYDKYEVPNDDLTPGREPGVFTVGEGAKATEVGMLICYEAVFPYISRGRVRDGAQVLVQATSDQTFDETPNPQQHADLCVLRAVETRRYFVRAGSTGLSQIIDASGRVRRNIPSLKAGTIVDTIVLRQDQTFFVRFGDWFVAVCGMITVSGVVYAFLPKRLAPVPPLQTPSSEGVALLEQTTPP